MSDSKKPVPPDDDDFAESASPEASSSEPETGHESEEPKPDSSEPETELESEEPRPDSSGPESEEPRPDSSEQKTEPESEELGAGGHDLREESGPTVAAEEKFKALPLILYQDTCPFCCHEAQHLDRLSGGEARCLEWTDAASYESVQKARLKADEGGVYFVNSEGGSSTGAAARAQALLLAPGRQWLVRLYSIFPLRFIFHLVLGPRFYGSSIGTVKDESDAACSSHARNLVVPEWSTYRTSTNLYIHLLAIITLIAFFSLYVQVHHLIGENGLIPATEYMSNLQGQIEAKDIPLEKVFHSFPTIFWWLKPDAETLRTCAFGGVVLSILILLRVFPRTCLMLQVVLYMSLATVCRLFLGFQWDNLLLESLFLALFLPQRRRRLLEPHRRPSPCPATHFISVFLMQWLLFRLYFESGISKIQAGLSGGWLDLSAMNSYYDTAPLPTWLGIYAHNLPAWFHEWESALTLLFEIMVPVFIFAGRRMRRMLLVLFTGLQFSIMLTGNYAFFNYLSLALNVFLIDDHDWKIIGDFLRRGLASIGLLLVQPSQILVGMPRWRARGTTVFLYCAGLILWTASMLSFGLFLFRRAPAEEGALLRSMRTIQGYYRASRVVNVYHLFANMTRERVMPEIQGSDDTVDWKPYRFHYAPGDPKKTPGFVAPHQPRFDFQLWFLCFEKSRVIPPGYRRNQVKHPYQFWFQTRMKYPAGREYFTNLLRKLLTNPRSVEFFFDELPYPSQPPKYLRLAFYSYHMSNQETFEKTGEYWTRTLVGYDYKIIIKEDWLLNLQ